MDRWMEGRMDERRDMWMDRQTDRRMDEWIDRDVSHIQQFPEIFLAIKS